MYVLLSDDGYLIGIGSTPYADGLQEPVELPDDLTDENWTSYRLVDGALVLDKLKLAQNNFEHLDAEMRQKREELLTVSDKRMLPDYPIDESHKQEWIVFRQALRDVTKQAGWPNDVEWPTIPKDK